MKKNKIYLSVLFASILVMTSCKDDDLDRLDLTTITSGAILRTLAKDLPTVNRNSPNSTDLSVQVEFDDFLSQDTMESVDVFVSFVDTSPVAGQLLSFDEAFMKNVPASSFTVASNGKLAGTIDVNIGEAMSSMGLAQPQLYGGDVFLMRLSLNTTSGNVYTSDNVGTKIQGSSAFLSPFRYSSSVVCPPPAGTWTIDVQDSYGDGWNGAAIAVNLNGETTNYTITDGSEGSFSVTVPEGSSALVFSYVNGSWDSEATFQITSPDGVITEGGPSQSGGPIKLEVDFCAL